MVDFFLILSPEKEACVHLQRLCPVQALPRWLQPSAQEGTASAPCSSARSIPTDGLSLYFNFTCHCREAWGETSFHMDPHLYGYLYGYKVSLRHTVFCGGSLKVCTPIRKKDSINGNCGHLSELTARHPGQLTRGKSKVMARVFCLLKVCEFDAVVAVLRVERLTRCITGARSKVKPLKVSKPVQFLCSGV